MKKRGDCFVTAISILIIKNMNHILKDAPSEMKGNMDTYSNPNLQ
ncbi:hypothetical protein [Psychrobacillus sp. L4]